MRMRIVAIIEKGPDGYFSVQSERKVGRYFFGGYGDNVKAAKLDFLESVRESLEGAVKEGAEVPDKIDVTFRYDIPSFFNCFDYLNVSKFAEYAGINESRMRAYKSGLAYPREDDAQDPEGHRGHRRRNQRRFGLILFVYLKKVVSLQSQTRL